MDTTPRNPSLSYFPFIFSISNREVKDLLLNEVQVSTAVPKKAETISTGTAPRNSATALAPSSLSLNIRNTVSEQHLHAQPTIDYHNESIEYNRQHHQYDNHYNMTHCIVHSNEPLPNNLSESNGTVVNTSEYSDTGYYNDYYPYDDSLRPYSAGSNSCSSSNSDSDSQLINHTTGMLAANDGHPNGAPATPEYNNCLKLQPNFELNCFNELENASISSHPPSDANYGNEYKHDEHHIGMNEANQNVANTGEHIQYTSVIVEPSNYHISNNFTH